MGTYFSHDRTWGGNIVVLKTMMDKDIYILGLESSCDDTSAAVLRNGVLLSNVTASQDVHREYGGVVPELASRAHQLNVVPVVDQAYNKWKNRS